MNKYKLIFLLHQNELKSFLFFVSLGRNFPKVSECNDVLSTVHMKESHVIEKDCKTSQTRHLDRSSQRLSNKMSVSKRNKKQKDFSTSGQEPLKYYKLHFAKKEFFSFRVRNKKNHSRYYFLT